MRLCLFLFFIVASASLFHCEQEQACTPGETQACLCSDGSSGVQVCAPGGMSWDACGCTSKDAGTTESDKEQSTEKVTEKASEAKPKSKKGEFCIKHSDCEGENARCVQATSVCTGPVTSADLQVKCTSQSDCKGLICVEGNDKGICTFLCDTDNDCAGGSGFCVRLGSRGSICAIKCRDDKDCFGGFKCITGALGQRFCYPE